MAIVSIQIQPDRPRRTFVHRAWLLAFLCGLASAQVPMLTLESLPRPTTPPPESGPVVPAQVQRWRQEALAYEHGDGVPRDPVRAAQLYCRAARYGDAEAQYNLAWMLTNARGIERDDAQAAHLFAAAAEQGMTQAQNMLAAHGHAARCAAGLPAPARDGPAAAARLLPCHPSRRRRARPCRRPPCPRRPMRQNRSCASSTSLHRSTSWRRSWCWR